MHIYYYVDCWLGTRVVTGSGDKTARLWDAQNGELITVLEGHTQEITSVAVSSDGTCLFWTWPTLGPGPGLLPGPGPGPCVCVIDKVLSCDIVCVSVSFARIVCATSHDLTFHMSCMHAWLALILLFCLVMKNGYCVGTVLNLCLTTLFWSWSLWGPRL